MMFSTVMKNIGVAHAESLVIKYFTFSAYISTHLPTFTFLPFLPFTLHFLVDSTPTQLKSKFTYLIKLQLNSFESEFIEI